jgi:uncharacterized membrane protein
MFLLLRHLHRAWRRRQAASAPAGPTAAWDSTGTGEQAPDVQPSRLQPRAIAEVFPIEHLAAALHLASVRGSFTAALAQSDLLVLVVWAIAAAVFAARRFSWLPATATA